ncbi:MBL fold metallo-hydrolase [Comamonas sp. NLF-1-9]|uniref:MBL fold metallo-hydrolase n=1 Tax=Comamonas sp. NLF-1-9 TaxID=2853163 RepID=UPI001C458993|nr:MBL fold metallo-hydrolase [Comamonas sp. NLF-1-9]QXL83585.1 MBL fold metallo-hydrolase [Comamonas sp. NLF-1-9]
MTQSTSTLLPEMTVFERSWLSANNILFHGPQETALVDSGYHSDAEATVQLVARQLGARPLQRLLNTHLHSDHCGGNAALQARWGALHTEIPPDQLAQVRAWDPVALSYEPTGQYCPPFRADAVLKPGGETQLGGRAWQIHAAPGHDPHAIMLFEPVSRILISGDALWENGFGVVFPELAGESGFDEVDATLAQIERLAPATIIPGHGRVFADVDAALARARSRLAFFRANPDKHALHAAKVLLTYKLMEWKHQDLEQAYEWMARTDCFQGVLRRFFPDAPARPWFDAMVQALTQAGVLRLQGGVLHDAS